MRYSEEDINILRLIRTKGIGLKAFEYLNKSFSSITYALNHVKAIFKKEIVSRDVVLSELKELRSRFDGNLITYKNFNYPLSLKMMNDFPPVLSYVGDINLLSQSNIAIVGSRNASIPFMNFANQLSANLVKCDGINIVSGLAIGIDTCAHKGAFFDDKARTIVVLPHGIGVNVYPASNLKLYKDIVQRGGLIISEFPLFTHPSVVTFHQRNRIIAGLSLGVIVVQARKSSGSLMTAKYAIDYNRQVFAVPGAPMSAFSEGANALIRDGAQIITSVSDTAFVIGNLTRLLDDRDLVLKNKLYKKIVVLDSHKKHVLQLLSYDIPVSIDVLVEHLNLSVSFVRVILVELYLEERIVIDNDDTVLLI